MIRLIGMRLVMAVPVLLVVTIVTFLLISLAPGDAATAILGSNASPEAVAALRAKLGLDRPWYEQWLAYLVQLLQGNMGNSILTGAPVSSLLNERLPVTLSLLIVATVFSAIVGVGLGTLSAMRGGVIGKVTDILAMIGQSIPNYWLALLLVAVFAVQLHAFPAIGYTPITESGSGWLYSLILPVVALSLSKVAIISRTTRDSLLDTREQGYWRTLRANGASRTSLLYKHAWRNASITVITVISLALITSITGAVFIENVFALPGLGSLVAYSTINSDLPVVQGAAIYFTLIVLVVNLIVDISYGWLNPKVRNA